jgi:hypothetical protein
MRVSFSFFNDFVSIDLEKVFVVLVVIFSYCVACALYPEKVAAFKAVFIGFVNIFRQELVVT